MRIARIGDTTFSKAHGIRWKDKTAHYMTTVVGWDGNKDSPCNLLCVTVARDHIEPKVIDFFVDEQVQKDDQEEEHRSAIETLAGKEIDAIIVDALPVLRQEYSSEGRPSSEQDASDRRAIENEFRRRSVPTPTWTHGTGRPTPS